jgi:hypothetical protein
MNCRHPRQGPVSIRGCLHLGASAAAVATAALGAPTFAQNVADAGVREARHDHRLSGDDDAGYPREIQSPRYCLG